MTGKCFFFPLLTVIRTSARVYKTLAWKGLLFVTNSTELHFLFAFHLKQTPESFKTLQCLYRTASSQLERSWHCWLQSQQVILFLTISQQNTASSICTTNAFIFWMHLSYIVFRDTVICLDKIHTLQRNPSHCFLVLVKVGGFRQKSLLLLGYEEGIQVGRSKGSQSECKGTAAGIAWIASEHWTPGCWRTRLSPGSPLLSHLRWGYLKKDWGVDFGSSSSPYEFQHLLFFLQYPLLSC